MLTYSIDRKVGSLVYRLHNLYSGKAEYMEYSPIKLLVHLILTKQLLEQGTVAKVQDGTTLCLRTLSRCKLTTRFPRARLQHLR